MPSDTLKYVQQLCGTDQVGWVCQQLADDIDRRDKKIAELEAQIPYDEAFIRATHADHARQADRIAELSESLDGCNENNRKFAERFQQDQQRIAELNGLLTLQKRDIVELEGRIAISDSIQIERNELEDRAEAAEHNFGVQLDATDEINRKYTALVEGVREKAIEWYRLAADDPLFSLMAQSADEVLTLLPETEVNDE